MMCQQMPFVHYSGSEPSVEWVTRAISNKTSSSNGHQRQHEKKKKKKKKKRCDHGKPRAIRCATRVLGAG
jgi:hypothetical protein